MKTFHKICLGSLRQRSCRAADTQGVVEGMRQKV